MDEQTFRNIAAAQAVAEGTGDEKTSARFFYRPVLNAKETEEAGRPVYEQKEFVEITTPGGGSPATFLANSAHRRRFKAFYTWFQTNQQEVVTGFPIEKWNQIAADKAALLKHFGFTTVEKLAEYDPENNPGLSKEDVAIVAMARDFLAGQDQKDKEIEELRQQIAQLAQQKKPSSRGKASDTDDSVVAA